MAVIMMSVEGADQGCELWCSGWGLVYVGTWTRRRFSPQPAYTLHDIICLHDRTSDVNA